MENMMATQQLETVQAKSPLNGDEFFISSLSDLRDKSVFFAAAVRSNPKVTYSQVEEIRFAMEDATEYLNAVAMLILNATNNVGE
jgi:hypothetical protein